MPLWNLVNRMSRFMLLCSFIFCFSMFKCTHSIPRKRLHVQRTWEKWRKKKSMKRWERSCLFRIVKHFATCEQEVNNQCFHTAKAFAFNSNCLIWFVSLFFFAFSSSRYISFSLLTNPFYSMHSIVSSVWILIKKKETMKTCKSISLLYISLVASTRQSTSVRCYQASFNDDLRAIKRCFVNINETKQFFFFSLLFFVILITGTRQSLSLVVFALFPILSVFI